MSVSSIPLSSSPTVDAGADGADGAVAPNEKAGLAPSFVGDLADELAAPNEKEGAAVEAVGAVALGLNENKPTAGFSVVPSDLLDCSLPAAVAPKENGGAAGVDFASVAAGLPNEKGLKPISVEDEAVVPFFF